MRIPYIVAVVAFTQMGNTDCGQIVKDPGFDLWCGDALCAWKTERGTIARVPTWHEGDSGVQLVDADTAIEQLTSFNSSDGDPNNRGCLVFDLVANIDDSAEVYLNVDVEGDGTLEMHERLPTSSWQPLSYSIQIKLPFDGVRFEIAKTGTGNAVIANLGVTTSDTCSGITPLDPGPRKNGAACTVASDCASNICQASPTAVSSGSLACMGCIPGADSCGSGMACGLADPVSTVLAVPVECIPQASRALGETCLGDSDCASQSCNVPLGSWGTCSSCDGATTCANGGACRQPWQETLPGFGTFSLGPFTCSNGASGAACAADADCTSGHCNGAVYSQCDDGRSCTTRDDCPVASDLTPGECTTVGIQGGSCE